MACLEHNCIECNSFWMDNNPSKLCPFCGSTYTTMLFDERCDDVDTPEYEEIEDDADSM